MFRFLFPKQAQRIAYLEKQNADLLERFEELYSHLDIHRAVNYAKPQSFELRKGCRLFSSSPWIDLITSTPMPLYTSETRTTFASPAKKPRKRKKGAK